jgi:Uma2 family endonuclease
MTTMTTTEKLYTVDDLLNMPDGDRYELVHGKLVERHMGTESNLLATRIAFLLQSFLETHPMGYVVCSETTFTCFGDAEHHGRKPDVAFVPFGRFPGERPPKGDCRALPDLVVEVVSPNDTAEEVSTKVAEYQSAGVPLVWVAYPSTRRILVHRLRQSPDGRISELTEADALSGEHVLAGFTCPVAKVFALPRPPT